MNNRPTSDVLVGELATVLGEHAGLICIPTVETDEDGVIVLSVRVRPDDQPLLAGAVDTVELYQHLLHVVDVGTLRVLAKRYDIDPEKLEALLPDYDQPAQSHEPGCDLNFGGTCSCSPCKDAS
jgi:hypothetical protein